MLGPRLERVEKTMGSTEPTTRDRERSVEVEFIASQPDGHPGCARAVSRVLVETVRTLSGMEHGLSVVEPPRGPAQPLETLGRLLGAHRLLKTRPRLRPASFLQPAPAAVKQGGRGLVGLHGHGSDSHTHRRASVGSHRASVAPRTPRLCVGQTASAGWRASDSHLALASARKAEGVLDRKRNRGPA